MPKNKSINKPLSITALCNTKTSPSKLPNPHLTIAPSRLNAVGYQNIASAPEDFTFQTMTFEKVNKGEIWLSDLKAGENFIYSYISFFNPATGGDRKFKYNEDGLCVQDNAGDFFGAFTWWTAEDLAGVGIEDGEDGWYSEDESFYPHPVQDFKIAFGEGFYVKGKDDGDAFLLHSGAVIGQALPLPVEPEDFNFLGNCTPVEISLSDFGAGDNFIYSYISFFNPATGGDRKFKYDEDGVCVQDNAGDFFGAFTWWTAEDLAGVGIEDGEDGWYSEDESFYPHPVKDFKVKAGEGLYVKGKDDGTAYLIVPSPL